MCNVWSYPTKPSEEISPAVLEKLPDMFFTNVTGGEPFVREDLPDIVEVLKRKSRRLVVITNGYFTDRIISLCRKFPGIGLRISIEGLPKANDCIRGIPDGFDRGLRTLLELRSMGFKDIGFSTTVQDLNCMDLVQLYRLDQALGYEFATSALHNSHYFHKLDNRIADKEKVCGEFQKLVRLLLCSKRPKDWFRAYFNYGLINYIRGNRRLLPCEMGNNGFFVDPWGDVLVCNGMDEKRPIGNLKENTWEEIWDGERARETRSMVKNCKKECWMIGSAAPAIWHHPVKPLLWVLENKFLMKG